MKNIIIYQPSKVGSTTVIHYLLNHYNLKRSDGFWCPSDNGKYPPNLDINLYHTHTFNDIPKGLQDDIMDGDSEVYFICLTREPISRNISGFFEPKQFHPRSGVLLEGGFTDGQLNSFEQEFINGFNHTAGIEWFETEFLNMGFGDLYDLSFNKEKGYEIYNNGNKKLLLIRMEDINALLSQVMSEFLGETFTEKLTDHNTSKERNYYNSYNKFKNNVTIPYEILEKVYESKHTKFFYTDNEISEFYKRWEKTV